MNPRPGRRLGIWLILAVAYAATGKLGLMLAVEHPSVTAVWPASGVALAAALLWGYGVWPGIVLGAFVANVAISGSAATSLGIAAGNTLEAMVGCYLVARFANGRAAFDRPTDCFKFAGLAGLLSAAAGATCGVTSLTLAGSAAPSQYGSLWVTWWLGDAAGALVAAPALVAWSTGPPIRWTWRLGSEAFLAMGLLAVSAAVVFSGWLPFHGFPFLCIPPLVWVALRLGRRGAATAVVTLGAIATWGTVAGYGAFVPLSPDRALLWLQGYMIVVAVMALAAAAAVVELRRVERERLSEIAAREGADARLRGEAKFRALLESAPDATVIADREGRIVLVNSQTEKVFGYARDELIGERVEILMPQQLRQRHEQHRERYVAEPRPRSMGALGLLGRRRDGAEFPVEISLSPIQTEEGVLISSAIRDVSERRRGEEARDRLAAIVEASEDAIIGKTLDGSIVTWNPGAQRLYGYAAEEVTGRSIALLAPPGREDEFGWILETLRRGESIQAHETVRRRKDGGQIDVSISAAPLRDSTGLLTGASVVARDITERKQAETALREANQELEAFTYSVSHDLRTPLRALRALSQALLEDYGPALDETGREYARRLSSAAAQMDALTLSLLSYSRVSRADVELAPIELGRVVADVLEQLEPEIRARAARVTVHPGLPSVWAHEATLGQVVSNLVSNAIKFVEAPIRPEVTIAAEVRGGRVRFRVIDNGVGIDTKYHEQIFQVFERLHPRDTYPGNGLGLAIVRKGVHRMGGEVGVESDVGRGSCFWVELRGEKS